MLNNLDLFTHPFSKQYWRSSMDKFKDTKTIVLTSILIALMIVVRVFSIFLSISFMGRRVYFDFIPMGICAMIVGPVVGMAAGALSDVVSYIIMPSGPFFIGYTISAVISMLIYALFFYRTKISIVKIFSAKLLVNIFVNIFLGTIWLTWNYFKFNPDLLSSFNFIEFFSKTGVTNITAWNNISNYFKIKIVEASIKNISLLILEIPLLFLSFKYLIPISKSMQIISTKVPTNISII